jgi:hypothetical protein
MNLLKNLFVSCTFALSALFPTPAIAEGLRIVDSSMPNLPKGKVIPVGQAVHLSRPSIYRSYTRGLVLDFLSYGISSIVLTPNSTVALASFGSCAGGRVSELLVGGTVYVTTRPFTAKCSKTRVCLINSKGCMTLRSSIKVTPFEGDYIVGTKEGSVYSDTPGQPVMGIPEGWNSRVTPDGVFSTPQPFNGCKVKIVTQTKTTKVLSAAPGCVLKSGELEGNKIQIPANVGYSVSSPLD